MCDYNRIIAKGRDMSETIIRKAVDTDYNGIAEVIMPIIATGETYALPKTWTTEEAMDFWLGGDHIAYVAEKDGKILGTYYIHPNQRGGGSHVCNCGYMTHSQAFGQGLARTMCAHSLQLAIEMGYKAMQYNFVVSSNTRAIALWKSFGFEVVGVLPKAFQHPQLGYVDANVMFKQLIVS